MAEIGQFDPTLASLTRTALAGRYPDDPQTAADPVNQRLYGECGRGPGAEADDHAVFYHRNGS